MALAVLFTFLTLACFYFELSTVVGLDSLLDVVLLMLLDIVDVDFLIVGLVTDDEFFDIL